ncbi:MAG: single-stranded DNA-binding protein [Desulforegulaceae bacterium]|nr:single-stranded DNA-binding protein [Desulforegulaceae bacterium]
MSSINKVILIGNLGANPEIRYFQDGTAVCNFNMATSENWTDKQSGEKREKTEWHRIVVFRRLAEICEQYLHKGSKVYVEGKLQTRSYEKDGQTRYVTEIVASEMRMLDKAPASSGSSVPPSPYENNGPPGPPDDDIPF